MYQQLWGYKVKEKLYLGVRELKRLNTAVLDRMKKEHISDQMKVTAVTDYVNYRQNWLQHVTRSSGKN
jgi:hypothetical protein